VGQRPLNSGDLRYSFVVCHCISRSESENLMAEQELQPGIDMGGLLRRVGRRIWIGKGPEEPAPPVLTSEQVAALWEKGEIPPPEFPDTRYGRFDRRLTQFTKWWSYLAGIGLLCIVLVLVIDVVGWKLFKWPFPSATDFVKNMNVVAVFLAVSYIQTDRGSTAIELFQKSFPRWLKVATRTFAWLLGTAACAYCAYRGVVLTHTFLDHMKRSDPPWEFVIWPFAAAMVIGFILLALSFVSTGIRDFIEFKQSRARYGISRKKAEKTLTGPPASE
jgi:TRAP-type C4-dicarboxylate transport system permease small subunit